MSVPATTAPPFRRAFRSKRHCERLFQRGLRILYADIQKLFENVGTFLLAFRPAVDVDFVGEPLRHEV